MATNITQYNATAGSNTSIDSINLQEGQMVASDVNNAIRSLMSHLKNVDTGSQALTALSVAGSVTATTSLKTPLIEFTDGDNALTIADGGNVTANADLTVSGAFTSQGIDDNSDATAITIDSSERVGIGTTSPASDYRVSIKGDYSSIIGGIEFDSGGGDKFTIGHGSATSPSGKLNVEGAGNLIINTNNTERMRIDSSGTLLWASTVGVNSSNAGISFNNATHPAINVSGGTDTNFRHRIVFHNGNGVVGIISTSGSSTTYSTSSDHRLKENVEDMTGAIDRVKQLLPKRFNFIADDTNTLVDGFLAHEAQSVVAEAVTGTHNEVDDDGNAVMQGIDQAKLVPLLTGALKEAITKIETLETANTALEARITALENA